MSPKNHILNVTSAPRIAWYPWLSLALFFCLGVVASIDMFVMGSLANPIKQALHLTDEQLGRLSYSFTFAGVLTAPLFGYLGDRYRRKWLLLAGLVLWSFATAGSGLAGGLASLLVWRALVGLGEGAYNSVSPSWVADLFNSRWRNFAFGVMGSVGQVGCCLGFLLGGYISEKHGWQAAFFVAGTPGAILAVIFAFVREPLRGEADGYRIIEPPPTLSEGIGLLKQRDFLIYVIGAGAYLVALGTLSGWGPVFLHRTYGLTNREASTFFALGYLLCGVPGSWLGGYIGSYFKRRSRSAYAIQLCIATLIAAAFLFHALLSRTLVVTLTWIRIEMFFAGLCSGAVVTVMWDIVPVRLRNSAVATKTLVTAGVCGFLSSILVGIISDRYGIGAGVLVSPIAFVVSGAAWWLLVLLPRSADLSITSNLAAPSP